MEYDKDIRKELEYLSSLDQTVINPFLIGVISDYYDKKIEKKNLLIYLTYFKVIYGEDILQKEKVMN